MGAPLLKMKLGKHCLLIFYLEIKVMAGQCLLQSGAVSVAVVAFEAVLFGHLPLLFNAIFLSYSGDWRCQVPVVSAVCQTSRERPRVLRHTDW